MRQIGIALLVMCFWCGSAAAGPQAEGEISYYAEHYPYISFRGKVYTAETEFTFPEGYSRVDSALLTPYQYWVSYLPLWHHARPAARIKGIKYDIDEISRSVHFPWRTSRFFDYTIPVQLLIEYALASNSLHDFEWWPKAGDTITWDRFLANQAVTYRGVELQFRPSERRDSTPEEIDAFVDLCARWTTYQVLANNCVPAPEGDPLPGDLFIATDSTGRKGVVYVIVTALRNDDGDMLYTVATGCSDKCDFHIPLFNDTRTNPWISRATIEKLADGWPTAGFYRPRMH